MLELSPQIIDFVLFGFLVVIALAIAKLRDLFAAIMLSGIFSLLSAGLFVVMDAVDVAFTEAAVGAGISTVLMLGALALTDSQEAPPRSPSMFPLVVVMLTGGALIYATLDMPMFGDPHAPVHQRLAPEYIKDAVPLAPNAAALGHADTAGHGDGHGAAAPLDAPPSDGHAALERRAGDGLADADTGADGLAARDEHGDEHGEASHGEDRGADGHGEAGPDEASPGGDHGGPSHGGGHAVYEDSEGRTVLHVGIPNLVTTLLASYRGYDTFGETTVVFTAGVGVLLLLGGRRREDLYPERDEGADTADAGADDGSEGEE